MVKVELERWEVIRIINLLKHDSNVNQELLDDGFTDFDDMLKEGIETNNNLTMRLKEVLEVY